MPMKPDERRSLPVAKCLKNALGTLSSTRKALFSKKRSGYFQLLFHTDPTPVDVLLLALGSVAAVGAGIPFPLLGILFGELVDELNSASCKTKQEGSSRNLQSSVNQKVLLMVYITIANFVAIYIHTGCWGLFGERLVHRLRKRYFQSLLRQEIAFFDRLPAGEVSTRLTSDIEIIRTGTSEKVGICISSFSYFLGAYAVAFVKDARLAGILVSLVPAYLLMAMIGGKCVRLYSSRISDHIASASSIALQSLSNIPLVHAFGASKRLETKFVACLVKAQRQGLLKAAAAAVQYGLLFFIAYSANALAFWQGSRTIAATSGNDDSGISTGAVYTVIFLLVDASFIVSQVAPFLQIFGAAAASAEKLQVDIERSQTKSTTSSETSLTPVNSSVTFDDVTFHYPSRPTVNILNGISLHFPAGKHTAIVGLSGSGKSTLGALITRLYDPNQGAILLDDRNIQDLNVRDLRRCIGTVQQESWLLDRSILENIAHGLVNSPSGIQDMYEATLLGPHLSDLASAVRGGLNFEEAVSAQGPIVASIVDLVRKAAILADAEDFIGDLIHGYATTVGSRGCELSGGQKQRVALARAIIKDPRILLLDEATSALDSASEQRIQASLKKVVKGRTTVSIAHRLATVRDADNIIVLRDGQVVEQGTHFDLLAKLGAYAAMVETQSLQILEPTVFDSSETLTADDEHEKASITSAKSRKSDEHTLTQMVKPTGEIPAGPIGPTAPRVEVTTSQRSLYSTMRGILSLARPQLLCLVIGVFTATIAGGIYSGEAVVFGHTIGSLNPCQGNSKIRSAGSLFGLLFFVFAILAFFANVVSGSAFAWVAEKVVFKVRLLSFRSLLYQDLQWHNSNDRTPTALLSYISKDANALAGLSGTVIGTIIAILANLIAGILLTHIIAWKIAVVLLATLPILLYSGLKRLQVLAQIQDRHRKAYSTSVGITVEAVDSIRTVATLSLELEFFALYCRSLVIPYRASFREIAVANFWLASAYSVSNLIYALAYWWGSKQFIAGAYSQTQFFIVLPALLFSAQSCGQMFALAPDVSNARVASARLLDLLELGPDTSRFTEDEDRCKEKAVEEGHGDFNLRVVSDGHPGTSIKFQDVCFSYPTRPDIKVLKGLNMDVLPGQFCAVVGPSGAGKTTILTLLEKFYKPSSGSIKIDGRDIVNHRDVSFRDSISLVPQDSTLLDDTIRFNIGIGARPDHEATDEEIESACKLANIHEMVSALPQGYETRCGSNGDQFSGGQKQRLAFARALVRRPRLLLLDESTSALDAESEQQFQEVLANISTSKITIIAIAHRLHTIQRADQIFLIEGGRCVEEGTHTELIQSSPSYRANALHQTL